MRIYSPLLLLLLPLLLLACSNDYENTVGATFVGQGNWGKPESLTTHTPTPDTISIPARTGRTSFLMIGYNRLYQVYSALRIDSLDLGTDTLLSAEVVLVRTDIGDSGAAQVRLYAPELLSPWLDDSVTAHDSLLLGIPLVTLDVAQLPETLRVPLALDFLRGRNGQSLTFVLGVSSELGATASYSASEVTLQAPTLQLHATSGTESTIVNRTFNHDYFYVVPNIPVAVPRVDQLNSRVRLRLPDSTAIPPGSSIFSVVWTLHLSGLPYLTQDNLSLLLFASDSLGSPIGATICIANVTDTTSVLTLESSILNRNLESRLNHPETDFGFILQIGYDVGGIQTVPLAADSATITIHYLPRIDWDWSAK